MIEIGHRVIQGRHCPRITFFVDDRGYRFFAFPGGMQLSLQENEHVLCSWMYDWGKKDWKPPTYTLPPGWSLDADGLKNLVAHVFTTVHEILDSDQAIRYFAALKPIPHEPAHDTRSVFSRLLGVTSAHFKADEICATSEEYLARRRVALIGFAHEGKVSPPAIVPFVLDLSAVP